MPATPRFLTLDQVAEELNVSPRQAYALVRRGEIAAVKIGGRGQWRVEKSKLEEYIAAMYVATSDWIRAHPPNEAEGADEQ